ncbi:hypothetical protein PRIPAC_81999 [Pristionchus pacificus]|nr:hypothetical protein PRIPAC_81999 [Pristionchus pacificus]
MARFDEVLLRARATVPQQENDDSSEADSSSEPGPFIDHKSFYEPDRSNSVTPLLDRIRKGYSLMCLIRKSAELSMKLGFSGNHIGAVLKGDLTVTLASYSSVIQFMRVYKNAILEFANLAFPEFRSLEESCKISIIESSLSLLNQIDSTYRAYRMFPDDLDVRMASYSTYIRPAEFATFFDNCSDDIDKENLIKEMTKSLAMSRKMVRQFFEIAKPTDVEFIAILGLALWNDDTLNQTEDIAKIARGIRSEMLRELHVHYEQQGTADYASRVGHIFCLLVNCQNHSETIREHFQVCRLMNLFEKELTEAKKNMRIV